jgi:hypothetical protein
MALLSSCAAGGVLGVDLGLAIVSGGVASGVGGATGGVTDGVATGSVGTSRIPLVWGKCGASRMCCRLRRSFTPFELLTMYDRGSSVCESTVEGSQHLVVVFNTMTCWPGNRGERSCLSACRSKYSC